MIDIECIFVSFGRTGNSVCKRFTVVTKVCERIRLVKEYLWF